MVRATQIPTDELDTPATCHLDPFPVSAVICLDAHGVCIGIRANRPEILAQILRRLPVGCVQIPSTLVDCLYSFVVGDSVRVYREEKCLYESSSLDSVLDQFEYDVELHVVEQSPRWVFVHAGVVGWNGTAVVIPGRSFSGKSTLVAALCQAGCVYYSDEYALFDREGRVHPYARPIRLRPPVGAHVASTLSRSVCNAGQTPLPVGTVIFTQYSPNAVWSPRVLTTGQALLRMMENTMSAQSSPQTVLPVLRHALTSAVCMEGVRGDTSDIVAACQSTEHLEQINRRLCQVSNTGNRSGDGR